MTKPNEALLDAVLQRASVDGGFRRKLLDEPDTAILDAFQVRLPEGVRIKFIERDPAFNAVHVLPDLRATEGELTEDELDAVAGGVAYRWDP